MRVIRLALIALLALTAAVAHAQTGSPKTTPQLNIEINSSCPNNTIGLCTPFIYRQNLLDMIASGTPAFGVSLDSFGANHDGVTDDTTALIAAETFLGTGGGYGFGGGIIQLTCAYSYLFATNHQIPPGIIIRHCTPEALVFGDAASGAPFASNGHINLSATWTLTNVSGVIDAVILNPACTFPATSLACYSGTALQLLAIGGGGVVADDIVNALIVGYKTCFDGTAGGNRLNLTIHCDSNGVLSTDTGVILGRSDDRGTFTIDTFPYGTTELASPILTRTGTGIHLLNADTAGMVFPRLLDLGHQTGVILEGSGGIEVGQIWTDTNSGYGLIINGLAGGANFHTIFSYTGGGVSVQSAAGTGIHIDYMFCSGVISGPNETCLNVTTGHVGIDEFDIAYATGYGLVVTTTTAFVDIGTMNWKMVNGGSPPYIAYGLVGATCNQITIRERHTDLGGSASLFGSNVCVYPTIASATTLAIPADIDLLQVTGTTTINLIGGVWGNRQLMLEFAGIATMNDKSTASGNISLAGSTNFTSSAGAILVLNYDQTANLWRQVSSSKP